MRFIVGDTIKLKRCDAFYTYFGSDFVHNYVPNLSHLYKSGRRPMANNQQFVIVSRTEYNWAYIIQEIDTGQIYVASNRGFRLLRRRDDIIIYD